MTALEKVTLYKINLIFKRLFYQNRLVLNLFLFNGYFSKLSQTLFFPFIQNYF